MQITNFDATNIPPQQSVGKHPEGTFPATISSTRAEPTKDQTGGIFVVEFSTAAGSIINRYNLWNKNEKAVEIAQKELSALCHATGIFKLSMSADNLANCGYELRGAPCVIKVRPQPNNAEYMEVEKVFDRNGNEPGKAPNPAPQPQQQAPQQPTAANPPANNGGWGQSPTSAAPQGGGGWQPGPSGGVGAAPAASPPWGK